MSDLNAVSRVDSYLTNMKMPWEKEAPPVLVTVGAIEFYVKSSTEEAKYDKLWIKTFSS